MSNRPGGIIDDEMFAQACIISGLEHRLAALEKAVVALNTLVTNVFRVPTETKHEDLPSRPDAGVS